ncbi:uncharacterized protein LOC115313565 [Ixodes scapularis]|uniref:uncharacterized protein LOC115313565 n=1 Tax=Ixodes scapularis TaxID=6945 RepID=UPI001A9DA716|nr:uncharacterized protein LOC115313565 [Ixodes scapularis]
MTAFSDQRGYTVADNSKRSVLSAVDVDGFQQVMLHRRVKASVGSAKTGKLRVVAKPPKRRAVFVSRLHQETTSDKLLEIVSSALGCQSFSWTKLAARYPNLNARSATNESVVLEGVLSTFKYYVVVKTETLLHSPIPDNDVFAHGFKVFRRNRGSRGVGVALLIRYTISCTLIEHGQDCEKVWTFIRFGFQSMLVGTVYRRPQASIDALQSLFEFLQTETKRFSRVVMTGDFNLPDINWNYVMPNGICNQFRLLVDIVFSNYISQVVTCPTRVSDGKEPLLDLVFISEVVTRSVLGVSFADGISDHVIVVCDLSAPQDVHNETETKYYCNFKRANDIDIVDFLEVALDRFLVF